MNKINVMRGSKVFLVDYRESDQLRTEIQKDIFVALELQY